jgi:hypothetical protein
MIDDALLERIAQAIHERYLEHQHGQKPPDDPAMQPWDRLPESLRHSDREQAKHIAVLLQSIGCRVRLASAKPVLCAFTAEEVETLATQEHARWVSERRAAGWADGQRDVERRTTPYLVPYANLPENIKEWDRQAVRSFPEVLASAGMEIYRP